MTIQDVELGSSYVKNIYHFREEIKKVEQLMKSGKFGWSELNIKGNAYTDTFNLESEETSEVLEIHLCFLKRKLKDYEDKLAML